MRAEPSAARGIVVDRPMFELQCVFSRAALCKVNTKLKFSSIYEQRPFATSAALGAILPAKTVEIRARQRYRTRPSSHQQPSRWFSSSSSYSYFPAHPWHAQDSGRVIFFHILSPQIASRVSDFSRRFIYCSKLVTAH